MKRRLRSHCEVEVSKYQIATLVRIIFQDSQFAQHGFYEMTFVKSLFNHVPYRMQAYPVLIVPHTFLEFVNNRL